MDVECPVCFQPFNEGAKLPKVVLCGHTVCLACLRSLGGVCPSCRMVTSQPAGTLPTNFFLLGLLAQNVPPTKSEGPGIVTLLADSSKRDKVLRLVEEKGVRRLTNLECHDHPKWAADVLRAATRQLEELFLIQPSHEHLALVHVMPRLRRLFINGFISDQRSGTGPVNYYESLPALQHESCLETFSMEDSYESEMPVTLLRSLLMAHSRSVRKLQIAISDFNSNTPESWILECGLERLQHLFIDDVALLGEPDSELEDADRTALKQLLGEYFPGVTIHLPIRLPSSKILMNTLAF